MSRNFSFGSVINCFGEAIKQGESVRGYEIDLAKPLDKTSFMRN